MPHCFSTAHFQQIPSSPKSWLDLYLPVKTSPPMPDARLTHRINKVQETLALIKPIIDIRSHLVALGETNGRYCTTCGPYPNTSYCSLSCPLLRTVGWIKSAEWVRMAKGDAQLYGQLTLNIDMHRSKANKRMVQEWEAAATDLWMRTIDSSKCPPTKMIKSHQGFNKHWTFEKHWGKGPSLEVELGPEESEPHAAEMENAK